MDKYNDEFDAFDKMDTDINEFFRGDVLDEDNARRLNELRDACTKLSSFEPLIRYQAYPFTNESRNGTVILDFPRVMFSADPRVMQELSEIFAKADDFCVSGLEDGTVRITVGIEDMWQGFHYEEP